MVKPSPFICFSLIHVRQVLELKWKLRELGRETKDVWVGAGCQEQQTNPTQRAGGLWPFPPKQRRPTLFAFAFLWEDTNIGVEASVKMVSPPSLA